MGYTSRDIIFGAAELVLVGGLRVSKGYVGLFAFTSTVA